MATPSAESVLQLALALGTVRNDGALELPSKTCNSLPVKALKRPDVRAVLAAEARLTPSDFPPALGALIAGLFPAVPALVMATQALGLLTGIVAGLSVLTVVGGLFFSVFRVGSLRFRFASAVFRAQLDAVPLDRLEELEKAPEFQESWSSFRVLRSVRVERMGLPMGTRLAAPPLMLASPAALLLENANDALPANAAKL